MRRFSQYIENKIYEGLLSDIVYIVKDKFTYFMDKAKKVVLQVVAPENIDGHTHAGVQAATLGEIFPLRRKVDSDVSIGAEPTTRTEKNNIKALIDAATTLHGDVNEAAVDGFGEINGLGKYSWKTRRDGSVLRNPVQDVDTNFIKKVVLSNIMKVSSLKGRSLPVLLFGAPGVGKTSIVNAVIDSYNSQVGSSKKKGIIVIDCANLGLESLSLVMPTKDKNTDIIADMAGIKLSDEERKALSKESIADMTKEWLPCYKPTGDPDLDAKADAIANGHVSEKGVTTDGGIILLDELLRVQDPGVFGQLMNLILTRKLGERVLGSKWTFICVSNRPNDDKTVANALKNAPSAFFNRFAGVYNVEPALTDWLSWARGGNAADSFDFSNLGELKDRKWRVDPRFCDLIQKNPKLISNIEANDIYAGELVGATNRSWQVLSDWLWDMADANNVSDWIKFPVSDLRSIIFGIIGKEYGQAVIDELDEWKHPDKKRNETTPSAMSDQERDILSLITEMESIRDNDDMKAKAKELAVKIKAFGEQQTNAIISPKIAEWGATTTPQRKYISKVISKVYPDLTGRVANFMK